MNKKKCSYCKLEKDYSYYTEAYNPASNRLNGLQWHERYNVKLLSFKEIAKDILEYINSTEFRISGRTYEEVKASICKKFGVDPKEFSEWQNTRKDLSEIFFKEITIKPDVKLIKGQLYDLHKNDEDPHWITLKYIGDEKNRRSNYHKFTRVLGGSLYVIIDYVFQARKEQNTIRYHSPSQNLNLQEITIEPVTVKTTYELFMKLWEGRLKFTCFNIMAKYGHDFSNIKYLIDLIKSLPKNELIDFYNDCKKELPRLKDLNVVEIPLANVNPEDYRGLPEPINEIK